MSAIRDWVRRHPLGTAAIAALMVAGAIFVLVWFQPQKLFLDETVDEAFPEVPAVTTTTAAPTTTSATTTSPPEDGGTTTTEPPATTVATTTTTTVPPGPELLASGDFIDVGHEGMGVASIFLLPDGSRVLRLEDLDVSNGPDLRVILSPSTLVEDRDAYDDGAFADLGELKGNQGNQNYELPADLVLDEYQTVAIWCRRFNYTFNAAPLDPAGDAA